MSEFNEMVERVEAWRAEHGGVPLVDDTEAIPEFKAWPDDFDWEREVDAGEVIEDLLFDCDGESPPERFVVLSTAWRQMGWVWMDASPETARRKRDTYKTAMRVIAEQRPPDACLDATDCQWEIVVAAELEMWDRVEALSARWRRLGPESAEHANLGLARLFVTSVLIAPDDRMPALWLDYSCTTKQLSQAAATALYFSAISIGGPSGNRLEWRVPTALAQAEAQRLYSASDAFERAEAEGARLDTLERALSAWADAVVGVRTSSVDRLRKSLDSMRELSKSEAVGPDPDGYSRKPLLLSQVRLAAWIQDYAVAVEAGEALTCVAPSDPWCWEILAQLRRQTGDDAGWVQAYERYVALNGEADNDWQASELLRLGLSHIEGLRLRDMIAAAPGLRSDVELTEALVGLDWPEFKDLSDEARERWLAAITNLSHPRVCAAFGNLRWAQAAEAVGEAVASELRARVTGPFENWLRSKTDLRELARRSPSEGRLVQELGSGRVTLGSIVRLIRSARTRSGDLGPRLDTWLSRTAALKEFVCNDDAIQALEQLAAVRNPSSHGRMTTTSEKDALAAYSRARSYLRQMSTIRRNTNENG